MSSLPAFAAVLLDLDGLVLDTEPTYLYAWQKTAAAYGKTLDDDAAHALFGQHAAAVTQALREIIGAEFDSERFHATASRYWYAYLEAHGVAAMPGLFCLLDCLTEWQIPYALATNSDAPYAEYCLERARLIDRFPIRVSRDQVAHGKPEPDLFLEAARRLGVDVQNCLILEDSPTGLEAAHRAGGIALLVQSRPVAATTLALAAAHFHSLTEVAEAIEAQRRSTAAKVTDPTRRASAVPRSIS